MQTPLSQLLRARRSSADMSQRELARLLGLSHVFLSECERGSRQLASKHWSSLCRFLGNVTVAELSDAKRRSVPVRLDISLHEPSVQDMILQLEDRLTAHRVTPVMATAISAMLATAG